MGWLEQSLSCAPWSFPSLETHPSQGTSCSSCSSCLPPSTNTEFSHFRLARRHRHIPKLEGDPWQQNEAGTDESTWNEEFLQLRVPWAGQCLGTGALNGLWDCSSSISLSWDTKPECISEPATLAGPSLKQLMGQREQFRGNHLESQTGIPVLPQQCG